MEYEDYVNMTTLKSDYCGHERGNTSTSDVNTWEYVQISGDESFGTRLYWSAFKDDNSGFEAFMVEDVARCDDEHYVTVVIQVSAFFDGARHMYFNSGVEDMGYLNYPDTKDLIKGLEIIRELELKYCSDVN